MQPKQVRRNPHLAGEGLYPGDGDGSTRLSAFIPIFLGIAICGSILIGLRLQFAEAIDEQLARLEDAYGRFGVKLQARRPRPPSPYFGLAGEILLLGVVPKDHS